MPKMARNPFQRWEKGFCIHNWKVEETEMLISMNMVGRAEVIFIKTMEPGRVGVVRSMKPSMLPSPRLYRGIATMRTLLAVRNKPIAYGISSLPYTYSVSDKYSVYPDGLHNRVCESQGALLVCMVQRFCYKYKDNSKGSGVGSTELESKDRFVGLKRDPRTKAMYSGDRSANQFLQ